ncbi:uncharacterized protein LOC144357037 [Saccoglossus kowalevskii]
MTWHSRMMYQKPCLFQYLQKKSLYFSAVVTIFSTFSVLLVRRVVYYQMNVVEQRLQARWLERQPSSQVWWRLVKSKYSEQGRSYHSLCHINDMFSHFDQHKDKLQSPETVSWAIFFHDMVYNPKSRDNEEKSAECSMNLPNIQYYPLLCVTYIWGLILNLKKTWYTVYFNMACVIHRFGTEDKHYLLDFDMAVLGWPQEEYICYANAIRQEYIHIPEKEYRERRIEVLKSFLQRKNIYATKEFRDEYEIRARNNIDQEIYRLGDPDQKIGGLGIWKNHCGK